MTARLPVLPAAITMGELAEAFGHEIDGSYVGGAEFAANVFAYVRDRRPAPLIMPADEFAAVKRAARTLANIVARNSLALEAARIEMLQNGPHAGMQWVLNSLPDLWDDEATKWDG